jgi:hypothetical protein
VKLAWIPSSIRHQLFRGTTRTPDPEDDDEFEMVQTYGIIPATEAAEPGTSHGGEQAALLGGESPKRQVKRDGHASLISCTSNLANTIIGSGTFKIVHDDISRELKKVLILGMLTFPLVRTILIYTSAC